MCKLKSIFVFTFLTMGCNQGDKTMRKLVNDSKQAKDGAQWSLACKVQENENLVKQKNYYCCDLHKDVKNLKENKKN